MRGSKKGFLLGALLGGLCAGVTALLYAPKKGSQMRKDIQKKCDKISCNTQEFLSKAKGETEELIEKAQDVIYDAKRAVKKLRKR